MLFLFIMRSNIRIFLCLCLISAGNIGFGQSKEIDIIKEFVSDPSLAGASAGIMVYDPVSGESLLRHNATTLLAPASVLKLVTSASALEMLGPEYHFKTIFGFCGRVDSISGILQGNLVVKGGGDPTLGSQWFKDQIPPDAFVTRWLATLKRRGVKKISGNLLIDVSAFDGYNVPGSWSWEDIGNYYGAVPSALTYSDNMVRLFFDSPQLAGAPTVLVRTEPETPGITWVNEVKSSPVNRDLAYVYGAPWGEKRKITGTIPCGRKDFLVKASMPEPPLHFGNYVIERLAAYGIKVEGSVVVSNESIEFVVLDYFESPRLADILKPLNQESINLFADHLVFQIALEKKGKGSFETGLKLIQEFWKNNGVRDTFFIDDGSGLSRFDAISAEQLTSMLSYMQRSNNAVTFRESLPSAGKGTLSGFSVTDFPGNTLQCKSGSINKVRAYAGYLKCDSGRDVAFAILVNNYASGLAEMGRKLQGFLLALRKNL
jgi:D-alanyl-D-alanine carboxypeptidase/D-alanyl-D-alanine-endopeptidase (penicillin-binding protein 4)